MSEKDRASVEALDALHGALADTLRESIGHIKSALRDPEITEIKGAAALLNVARQFLKDNGVEAVPTPESPLGKLVDELPFNTGNADPSSPRH